MKLKSTKNHGRFFWLVAVLFCFSACMHDPAKVKKILPAKSGRELLPVPPNVILEDSVEIRPTSMPPRDSGTGNP